jgi:hypothetical protein
LKTTSSRDPKVRREKPEPRVLREKADKSDRVVSREKQALLVRMGQWVSKATSASAEMPEAKGFKDQEVARAVDFKAKTADEGAVEQKVAQGTEATAARQQLGSACTILSAAMK